VIIPLRNLQAAVILRQEVRVRQVRVQATVHQGQAAVAAVVVVAQQDQAPVQAQAQVVVALASTDNIKLLPEKLIYKIVKQSILLNN
jgi:hypothetical protein